MVEIETKKIELEKDDAIDATSIALAFFRSGYMASTMNQKNIEIKDSYEATTQDLWLEVADDCRLAFEKMFKHKFIQSFEKQTKEGV